MQTLVFRERELSIVYVLSSEGGLLLLLLLLLLLKVSLVRDPGDSFRLIPVDRT